MPLQCLSPAGPEYAFRYTPEGWRGLRAKNAAERHLHLPCCGSGVVLKRSPLGTLFFAHERRGSCTSAPESTEHLILKSLIAQAAEKAGWIAATEVRGATPEGKEWVADVLCTKPGSSAKVAFEVQWSPQTWEETELRQKRYQDSGVRAVWLMRQAVLRSPKETPAFQVRFSAPDRPEVLVTTRSQSLSPLPSKGTDLYEHTSAGESKVALGEFVAGALSGQLKFAPSLWALLRMRIFAAPERCWRCDKDIWIALAFAFEPPEEAASNRLIAFSIEDVDARGSSGAQWAGAVLEPKFLKTLGIGPIKSRYSKTLKKEYLSNGCVHCGALQGQHFYPRLYHNLLSVGSVSAEIQPWMIQDTALLARLTQWIFLSDGKKIRCTVEPPITVPIQKTLLFEPHQAF